MHGTMLRPVILCLALVTAAGCARSLDDVGSPGNPLVLLLSPFHAGTPEARRALEEHLSRETGLAVEVRAARSEAAAVNLIGADKVDAAILPVFDFLFCHQEHGVDSGLQVLRRGARRTYAGEVVVLDGGPVKSLADLDGEPFGYVDAYSTSGFLLPAHLLREAGVKPQPVFTGTHEAALAALRAGKVSGAATHEGMDLTGLEVLARTAEIQNEPVFFRQGLAPALRDGLAEGLVRFAETEAGRRALASMGEIGGFAPVEDGAYQPVHALVRAAGQELEDLVPRGWRMRHENRRPLTDYAP